MARMLERIPRTISMVGWILALLLVGVIVVVATVLYSYGLL